MFNSKEIKVLKEENNSLNILIKELRDEISDLRRTVAQNLTAKTDFESQVTKLKEELNKEKNSLNKKVTDSLADIGVVTFVPEEISANPKLNAEQVYSKFISLTGIEKGKYFSQNKELISKYLNIK